MSDSFFITITAHENGVSSIIDKKTNLQEWKQDYLTIFTRLQLSESAIHSIDEGKFEMKIEETKKLIKKGWVYNSVESTKVLLYTLCLIKIHDVKFPDAQHHSTPQDAQTQTTWLEPIVTETDVDYFVDYFDQQKYSYNAAPRDSDDPSYMQDESTHSFTNDNAWYNDLDAYPPLLPNLSNQVCLYQPYSYQDYYCPSPVLEHVASNPYVVIEVDCYEQTPIQQFPVQLVDELKNRFYQPNYGLISNYQSHTLM